MSNFLYDQVYDLTYNGVLTPASTIKVMLCSTNHALSSKSKVNEVTEIAPAAGYVGGYGGAGRKSLGSLVSAVDTGTSRTRMTGATQAIWHSGIGPTLITLGTVISSAELILEAGGADTSSWLIAHIDKLLFPYTIASTTLPFRLTFDLNEIFSFIKVA